MINRILKDNILKRIKPNKVVVLSGARRTGKTILLQQIRNKINEPYLLFNGEDFSVHELLEKRNVAHYRQILGNNKLLIIDEAQKIPDIGNILKLFVDEIEGIKIIVTGSSAFDMKNETGEPLTGRQISFTMFPLTEKELEFDESITERRSHLEQRLVYGNYPELQSMPESDDKQEYLREIINSYLLKDILSYDSIRNSGKIFNLLKLVAYQIGGEVSNNELGQQLGISKNTVEKYLDLLTKVFVLFKVDGYNRNLRKEVTKSSKWYFADNGIRNAIIANFQPVSQRNDMGILWENYIISERVKYQSYNRLVVNNYFWRTYDHQEIDWVEEREGNLFAYEMKWSDKKCKVPGGWQKAYPDSTFTVISPENYREWIGLNP